MPGIFGYASTRDMAEDQLEKMAAALDASPMAEMPSYRVELHAGPGFGLGRSSLGVFNPGRQPCWNADQTICLVFEGELFDQPELRRLLRGSAVPTEDLDAAGLALALYQQIGDGFVNQLNGAFILALWDGRASKLLVANDRIGLYPLYYAQTATSISFASGVRALMVDPSLPRTIDLVGMAQFLAFDHMLDDRTLLESARLLPQASCLTWQNGRLKCSRYWELRYLERHPLRSEEDYLEELKTLLRKAIRRQAPGDLSAGLLLSGGLDSRMLLGLLSEVTNPRELHTFTWGVAGSDDARFARELAAARRTRHHEFRLTPDWVLEQANEAVRLTDGLGNIVHMHSLAAAREEGQLARVAYKGFMGDAMFGFSQNLRYWADYDPPERYQANRVTFHDLDLINFDEQEQLLLLTSEIQRAIGSAVQDSWHAALDASGSGQPGFQRLYFDLRQRVPRMTLNGVEVLRSHMGVRLVYADYDLLTFTQQLPLGHLYQRKLVTRAFIEMYHDLAKIPITPRNLPMVACSRDVLMRGWELARWHLRRRGLGRLVGPDFRPYKDYHNWFRGVLRSWMEEVLLSPRALERGYFNPDYVRKLVADHLAGANLAVKLGGLISLELWHRQFLD